MNASRTGGEPSIPLPPLLTVGGAVPFVARASAWSELEAAWSAAGGAARRVLFVAGDAGTGKTRTLAEFARSVQRRGAVVLYGACSHEQSVPFQPFAEAFGALEPVVGPRPDLNWLLRGSTVGDDPPGSGTADPDALKLRRFRAVSTAVAQLAHDRPVLFVLDDLHWARRPTIELLTHLVRDQTLTNLLIVAAFRSTPSDVGQPLRDALPDLHRTPGVSRLRLDGFDTAGIADFVAAAVGTSASASTAITSSGFEDVVDVLARQTDGNPFLLVELWLHLVETGYVRWRSDGRVTITAPRDVTSPDGVREVVAARLGRLETRTRELLEVAAVVGPTFSPGVVAAVVGVSVADTLATLEPAARARLVDEDDGGSLRFAHELIRRSIYDGLGVGERRRLHHAVALALAASEGAVAERARHLLAAVPVVDPGEAVAAARAAADAATRAVAFDDAARFLDAALAYAVSGRGELLLESASAMMRSGDADGAKERCTEAHELARAEGDSALQIAAALAYGEASWRVGSLSYLADTCRLVGDREAAAAIYEELVSWRGLIVHVGFLLAAHGAVDRHLGELAVVLGWEREAEIHLDAALALAESTAMPLWIAQSQVALGRFLADRGRTTDAARATERLDAARVTADRLGLGAVAAAAGAATRLASPAIGWEGLTEREVAVVALVAEGCSNREIGRRLHISQHTAANHVRSILMKTACANRTEAATWALRRGLTIGA